MVSVNLNGVGGNGNSTYGGMSPDGRYVVFTSDASDLVAGDTNGANDIFVRDLVAGTTVLVSVSTSGIEGNGGSTSPVMTPNGRYVAFISSATNLVVNDANGIPDVFVRDLTLQTTVLASVGATSTYYYIFPFNGGIYLTPPAITPDGRYVTFATDFGALVPGVNESAGDVYVRDLVANQTIWASTNASTLAQAILGGTHYQTSEHPVISDDGTLVTFKTGSRSAGVIFQYNMTNGTTTTVYTNALFYAPPPPDDFYGPETTPDGRFIAFVAKEAASIQWTNFGSLRLWDSQTGTNVLVSANTSGVYSTGTLSQAPVVTPDGHYVVFLSNAGDLTGNTVSNGFHVFLRDMVGGAMTMLDVDTNGAGSADFAGMFPSLSTNGQSVAFSGPDGGLVALDNNGAEDVFLWDATSGTTQLISQRSPAVPVRSGAGLSAEGPLSISADGRWAAFASYANDLVPNDTNNRQDVFVCDRWSGSNILASVAQNGGCALGGQSMSPMISTNGRFVIFLSAATNLTADVITNPGTYNIYRRDLQLQTTVLVTVNTNGATSGDKSSSGAVISQDGRYVAFFSQAHNLAPGIWTGAGEFWRDIDGGATVALFTNTLVPFPSTMSADGRFVAYCGAIAQVRVWDHSQLKNIYTNTASFASISPDGSRLLYQNGGTAYVQDLVHGTNLLTLNGAQRIRRPGLWSGNGRFVAVVTSSAISGLDANNTNDVYLFDLLTPTNILVSVNSSLTGSGNAASDWPAVSWDGRFVIFRSFSTNLVAGHANAPDLYLYDSVAGTNSVLILEQPASELTSWPSQPVFSVDGSTAVFQSCGSGLAFGDLNGTKDVFAAVLPPAANADTDGDGIPDWWMIQYFGHVTGQAGDQSLAQDDPNGTGMTTLQDYIAGTNPTDPTSVFQALVVPPVSPGGNVALVWTAAAGRTYSVQYKDDLNDPVWHALGSAPTINGNQGQITVPADQPSRYYRIVVQ